MASRRSPQVTCGQSATRVSCSPSRSLCIGMVPHGPRPRFRYPPAAGLRFLLLCQEVRRMMFGRSAIIRIRWQPCWLSSFTGTVRNGVSWPHPIHLNLSRYLNAALRYLRAKCLGGRFVADRQRRPSRLPRNLAEHWDGSQWTIVPSTISGHVGGGFNAVTARSSSDVWAIGDYPGAARRGRALGRIVLEDGLHCSVAAAQHPGRIEGDCCVC